ncbi:diguanylate cyclase [Methyloversatilis thermotolerans]|uniref:diguanylate cyclase n=1 Tax=Methyloversatilis thermotolerans TaxID=1346290 RepID=UPI00036A5A79|nr:diguanylate cyclase [Methyloversatilis thermotolerans]
MNAPHPAPEAAYVEASTPYLGFARRSYRARMFGLLLGLPMVLSVLYQRGDYAWAMWLGPLLHAFVWPHFAWWRARQSSDPFRTEGQHLLADHFFGGVWTAMMAFSAVPSLLMLALMSMDSVAGCGMRLMMRGIACHALGVLFGVLLYGFEWAPMSSLLTVLFSAPMLLHPVAIGYATNQAVRKLQQQREALQRLSRTDALSGLANRGHWEALVRKEFASQRRYGHNVTLVLADLDHFKAINDRHGHAAGDEVIRRFATLLMRELRINDSAGRYGGEEFGILLPDTTAEGARDLMNRLRACLHAEPLIDGEVVTASFGVAELNPLIEDCEAWMRVADQMLYRAKHAGRDRVVLPGAGLDVTGIEAGAVRIPSHMAAAALRPEVLRQLLAGLDAGETACALFDPQDRLVFANAAFVSLYAVPQGDITFGGLMRRCHELGVGPRIETQDIAAWLAVADGRRRSQPRRSFEVDMMDGTLFKVEETTSPDGWMLTTLGEPRTHS